MHDVYVPKAAGLSDFNHGAVLQQSHSERLVRGATLPGEEAIA